MSHDTCAARGIGGLFQRPQCQTCPPHIHTLMLSHTHYTHRLTHSSTHTRIYPTHTHTPQKHTHTHITRLRHTMHIRTYDSSHRMGTQHTYTHTVYHTRTPPIICHTHYTPTLTYPQVNTLVHTDIHSTRHKFTPHHIHACAIHTHTSLEHLDKLSETVSVTYKVGWVPTSRPSPYEVST